ncbi:MAG: hypothetical protein FJW34_11260 [Acidobacteria bacterium]|nr:hypothetical protein [Acidobacteriota bacterium]
MNGVTQGPPGGGRTLSGCADIIALAVITLLLGFTYDSGESSPFDRLLAPITRVAAAASLGGCAQSAVGDLFVK